MTEGRNMNNRKTGIVLCLILAMSGTAYSARPEINKTKLPDQVRAKQIQDMKWGMFICWSFSTFYGQEWTPTLDKDASFFKATGCDTDQWCQTAGDAGMGYILFLAKHKGGAMWFYSLPKHDNLCYPASKVFKDYQGAMKYGNIFSINIGPNYAGKIRDIDVKTLKQVGEMIRAKNSR